MEESELLWNIRLLIAFLRFPWFSLEFYLGAYIYTYKFTSQALAASGSAETSKRPIWREDAMDPGKKSRFYPDFVGHLNFDKTGIFNWDWNHQLERTFEDSKSLESNPPTSWKTMTKSHHLSDLSTQVCWGRPSKTRIGIIWLPRSGKNPGTIQSHVWNWESPRSFLTQQPFSYPKRKKLGIKSPKTEAKDKKAADSLGWMTGDMFNTRFHEDPIVHLRPREESFENLVESSGWWIILVSPKGLYVYWWLNPKNGKHFQQARDVASQLEREMKCDNSSTITIH